MKSKKPYLLAQTLLMCYDERYFKEIFMLPKKKFREIVFQLLYSNDFMKIEGDEYIATMMKMVKTTRKNILAAYAEVVKIEANLPLIDDIIQKAATDYKFKRISKVELNILRLCFYEMNCNKLLSKIAIAEGLRLCSKFSSKESAKFVNAILDSKTTPKAETC